MKRNRMVCGSITIIQKLNAISGDVRDFESINSAMKGIDYVFHAALLKQVFSCEFSLMEAMRTDFEGRENVLNAAIEKNVLRFIVLSADKAVYPINAMGMSKAQY